MPVKQQLLACYALLSKDTDEPAVSSNTASSCTLFFSISDSTKRAHVFHVSDENFEKAWQIGAHELQRIHEQQLSQPDNETERTCD